MNELQLSRVQQIWLMSALVVSCAPIWYFLPPWVAACSLGAISWRAYLLSRGHAEPNRWVMLVLSALLGLGILLQFRPPIGIEPMSAILTAAAGLKFLEMCRRRESQLLIYLCLFISAIQPIYAQNMGSFLLSIFSIVVVLTAQSMLQRDTDQQFSLFNFSFEPVRQILQLVAVSIPLTLVIFVLAPRLPAFSVIPIQIESATTGISDFMDPGSISSLSNSNEVAFRVDFEGEVPAARDLYWRGLVLDDFDGRAWEPEGRRWIRDNAAIIWPNRATSFDWRSEIERLGDPIRYSVFLEPTQETWLFALPAAASSRESIGAARNLVLTNRIPVSQPTKYDVVSHPQYRHQPDRLDGSQRRDNLDFAAGSNPRTEALVQDWVDRDGAESVLPNLLSLFNQQFVYTMEPPTYPGNAVDEFIFDGLQGFCEHFASATAAILRMAGIPARVVAGYQGGEVHPTEGYLIVHQYNAHAWVEYWQQGAGWTRVDPTAAVAPDRIELGFEQYFLNDEIFDESLFSLDRLRGMALFDWVRLQLDSLNYRWLSLVLGYDTTAQFDLLENLLGQVTPLRLALVLILILAVLVAVYLLWKRYQVTRNLSAEQKLLRAYLRQLQGIGLSTKPAMTLQDVLVEATGQFPEHRDKLISLTSRIEQMLYQVRPVDLEILKRDIKALKPS
jgi:protein-glutamine gamma-glutamyltransferase